MSIVSNVVFWGVFAAILACVEIESEGQYGWAERMPTWFRTTGFAARVYGSMMGGKPLTGYHLFMFILPLLVFHSAFFMGLPWTIEAELKALAMYAIACPLWDFDWFVLNPWYRGKFTQSDIWWHHRSIWVLGWFPIDYLIGLCMSCMFMAISAWWVGSWTPLLGHLEFIGGLGLFTVGLRLLAPVYRRWYWHMRHHDERRLTSIFHTFPPLDAAEENHAIRQRPRGSDRL